MNKKKRVQILIAVLTLCLCGHSAAFSKQKGKVELVYQSMTVMPEVAVPNDTVNVTVMYELKGIDLSGIEVTESKKLLFGEREIASLENNQVRRTDGKWVIETTFLVPASATHGKYEVRQVVYSKFFSKSQKGFFRIESPESQDEKRLAKAEVYAEKLKAELEADIEETMQKASKIKRKREQINRSQTEKHKISESGDGGDGKAVSMVEEEIRSDGITSKNAVHINTNELTPQQKITSETQKRNSYSEKLKINKGLKIENEIEGGGSQQDHGDTQSIIKTDKSPEGQVDDSQDKKELKSEKITFQSDDRKGKPSEKDNVAEKDVEEISKTSIENKRSDSVKKAETSDVQKQISVGVESDNQEIQEKKSPLREKVISQQGVTSRRSEYSQAKRKKDSDPGWVSNSNQKDPRISKLAKRDTLKDGGFGPWMIVFPLGSFTMGGERYNEKPVHTVNIENQYSIMMHEVTVGMYQQYRKSVQDDALKDVDFWRREYPVVNVTWQEAKRFAVWLSEQTSHTYRLPTEAEWEYVAKYCIKKMPADEPLLFRDSIYESDTQVVGDQSVEVVFNSFGDVCKIYGMRGNVWEWTENCWSERYYREHNGQGAYSYPNCGDRTVRGGSYMEEREKQTPTLRMGVDQKIKVPYIGFRLVREGGF